MTTVAQVKQVIRPLLEHNPDLTLIGRMVVIKPVNHILRAIYIDRCGNSNLFEPTWATIFIFEPNQRISFNWGERVYRREHGKLWDVNDPATPLRMAEEIERQALPLLRPLKTIDDFVSFTTKERFPHTALHLYPVRKIFVDVARGDFESAQAISEYLTRGPGKTRYVPDMVEEYDRVVQQLCPLIATRDKAGLARTLHEFEAWSVKAMKLEMVWERTPFPIEL